MCKEKWWANIMRIKHISKDIRQVPLMEQKLLPFGSQNVWDTIMPFGTVTKFFTGPNFFFRASQRRLALISATADIMQ
jgi:hypothetical protein